MNLELKNTVEQPLLRRKMLHAHVKFTGATPKGEDVQKELAKAAKADAEVVVVKKIDNKFGKSEAEVKAFVYDSPEAKLAVEGAPKVKEKKED